MILTQTPNNCTLIVGPPNFGMIGTIVTEFLISHLNMSCIGSLTVPGLPPVVAVHQGKILDPVGLFYYADTNLLAVHIAANVVGREHEISDAIAQLCAKTSAVRLICVDGLFDESADEIPAVWYVTKSEVDRNKLNSLGVDPLADGIVSGPTALLLSAETSAAIVALLASSHERMADSAAAASILAALDEWLELKIDPALLLDYARQFEEKWLNILSASSDSKKEKEIKYVSYVG